MKTKTASTKDIWKLEPSEEDLQKPGINDKLFPFLDSILYKKQLRCGCLQVLL
jgi:hypothetical protein